MKEQRIDTIKELEKEIGNLIVLYYYRDAKELFDLNCTRTLPKSEVSFMWMMKLTSITYSQDIFLLYHGIRKCELNGDDIVVLMKDGKQKVDYYSPHTVSSAQMYIRKPTEEEIKSYKNLLRYRKIFGKSPNPSQITINENK